MTRAAWLLLLAIGACRPAGSASGSEPTALVADPPAPSEAGHAKPIPAVREELLGSYASPSCGARHYARTIGLQADGFEATDVPHPCPGECVVQWSVARKGTWTVSGSDVVLHVESTDDPQHRIGDTVPLPAKLTATRAGLVEHAGSSECRYRH